MGKIVRALSVDGSVLCMAIDTTDIVNEIYKIHQTTPVVSAALGRTATATAMMGSLLKNESDSITVRIDGKGPCGMIIAVADFRGNVRCYATNPQVELPLNEIGKLNVGECVGTDGNLAVVKDMGLKEPYVGQVPLVSGEIGDDITSYYGISEQIPTVCGLGVLVDRDWSIKHAGGFMIQLVPPVNEAAIDVIEKNIKNMTSVTQMLENGYSPEDIITVALEGMDPNILDSWDVSYKCNCSRERMEQVLLSIGKDDLQEIIDDKTQDEIELVCHFCNEKHSFEKTEIQKLKDMAEQ